LFVLVELMDFGEGDFVCVCWLVSVYVVVVGFGDECSGDVVLVVIELVINSLCYGGGCGMLCTWCELDVLVYEVCDVGYIEDFLVGCWVLCFSDEGGCGVWMVN